MKRNFCYVLLMLFALAGNINADELKIEDIVLSPGQQAEVAVELDNPDSQYIMLDFYIQLPEGISVASDEDGYLMYELNSSRTLRSHILQMEEQAGGNYHVLLYSSRNEALKGTSGAVFTMTLEADAALEPGEYEGKLTNQITSDPDINEIDFADRTFKIIVTNTEDVRVILDENATVMPEAATGVNVRVKRTIPANSWSTIALPFSMDEEQAKSAFGDDVQLLDFNGYVTEEDEDGNIVALEIQFNPLTSIEANHPCMIRVSEAISEFDADNVDIDPEEEPTVAAIRRTKKQWSEMIGTYTAGSEVPYTCIFVSGNNFYYSIGKTVMKGFRAYFDFYDVLTDIENEYAVKIRMNTLDNEPTGIDGIKKGSLSEGVYTLQGIFLGKDVDMDNVPSGFYIVNGKKHIKK